MEILKKEKLEEIQGKENSQESTIVRDLANLKKENFDKVQENHEKDEEDEYELTTIYKCPMCFKKFANLPHIEKHIFKFHKIPIDVQRRSMHGGHAMSIIKEKLQWNVG